jgi:hypothetical protein
MSKGNPPKLPRMKGGGKPKGTPKATPVTKKGA